MKINCFADLDQNIFFNQIEMNAMVSALLHCKTCGITRKTIVLNVIPSRSLKDPAINPTLSFLISKPSHFVALGFGLGLAPPGTCNFRYARGIPGCLGSVAPPLVDGTTDSHGARLWWARVPANWRCAWHSGSRKHCLERDRGTRSNSSLCPAYNHQHEPPPFCSSAFLTLSNLGRFGSLTPDSRLALASCSMICSPYLCSRCLPRN